MVKNIEFIQMSYRHPLEMSADDCAPLQLNTLQQELGFTRERETKVLLYQPH